MAFSFLTKKTDNIVMKVILAIISILFLFIITKKTRKNKKAGNGDYQQSSEEEISLENEDTSPNVMPCEERIKTAYADENGLFPHEILLMNYAPSFVVGKTDFQGFWFYKYGISDVAKILSSLVKRGFLNETVDIETNLKHLTVSELKTLLKENGIASSGKKDALIKSALADIASEVLRSKFPEKSYVITDKGKSSLDKSSYVMYIHKLSKTEDINIWNMNRLVHDKGDRFNDSFPDLFWNFLNDECLRHASERNYGMYRNTRLMMYDVLMGECKYNEAYLMLMDVIFYDVNSYLGNNFSTEHLDIYFENFFESHDSIAPTVINYMNNLQNQLGITDDSLRADFESRLGKLKNSVPLVVFSPKEIAEIYLCARDESEQKLKKIYAAKRRVTKA